MARHAMTYLARTQIEDAAFVNFISVSEEKITVALTHLVHEIGHWNHRFVELSSVLFHFRQVRIRVDEGRLVDDLYWLCLICLHLIGDFVLSALILMII